MYPVFFWRGSKLSWYVHCCLPESFRFRGDSVMFSVLAPLNIFCCDCALVFANFVNILTSVVLPFVEEREKSKAHCFSPFFDCDARARAGSNFRFQMLVSDVSVSSLSGSKSQMGFIVCTSKLPRASWKAWSWGSALKILHMRSNWQSAMHW